MKVELKRVKVCGWASQETTCFQADVWFNGRLVAHASNDGGGGSTSVHAVTGAREEFAAAAAWCAALPPMRIEGLDEDIHMTMDLYIENLIYEVEKSKEAKRWAARIAKACRTQTLFRLVGDEKDSYRTLRVPIDDRARAWLKNKYGDKVVEIINDTLAGVAI